MPSRALAALLSAEPQLSLDEQGELVVRLEGEKIIDFYTHFGPARNLLSVPNRMELRTKPVHTYPIPDALGVFNLDALFYGTYPVNPIMRAFKKIGGAFYRWRNLHRAMVPAHLDSMRRNQITYSVLTTVASSSDDDSIYITDTCRKYRNLIPFCSVHPHDPHKRQKLVWYKYNGAKGIFFDPRRQGFHPGEPAFLEVIIEAERLGLLVMVNIGLTGQEPGFGPWADRNRFASVSHLAGALTVAGDIPFILTHAGRAEFFDALALAERWPNIYLETSLQPPDHLRLAIKRLGDHRLLFGSGWPFCLRALPLLCVLRATEGKPQARRRILYDNAARILGLPQRA